MQESLQRIVKTLELVEPTAGILVVSSLGKVVSEHGKAIAIFGGSSVGRNVDDISGLPPGTHAGYRLSFLSNPDTRPMRTRSPIVIRRLSDGAAVEVQIGLVPLPKEHTAALFHRPRSQDFAAGAPAGVPVPMTHDSGKIDIGGHTIREWMAEIGGGLDAIRRQLGELTTSLRLAEQRGSTIERDLGVAVGKIEALDDRIDEMSKEIAVMKDRGMRQGLAVGGSAGAAAGAAGAGLIQLIASMFGG